MSHIPPYVFVLMVALLYVGISRCFSRTMRVERLLVLPALMTIFGVRGFLGLFPQPGYGDLIAALAGGAIGWHHARVGGSASIAADGSSASQATS